MVLCARQILFSIAVVLGLDVMFKKLWFTRSIIMLGCGNGEDKKQSLQGQSSSHPQRPFWEIIVPSHLLVEWDLLASYSKDGVCITASKGPSQSCSVVIKRRY